MPLTGSIDVNFCGPSGSCNHISVSDFNGTPCIGIGVFSVVIKLEDLDGLTRTLNDSVELWKSHAEFLRTAVPVPAPTLSCLVIQLATSGCV